MIELLLESLMLIARWDVAIALLVGSIGGVIIGAIPGVGPAVAIAILLPATYKLEPLVGLTVLLGIYGAALYGGAALYCPEVPFSVLLRADFLFYWLISLSKYIFPTVGRGFSKLFTADFRYTENHIRVGLCCCLCNKLTVPPERRSEYGSRIIQSADDVTLFSCRRTRLLSGPAAEQN